jgi:CHAD domain-containing protein
MGSRPIERELKLDADEDFVIPELSGVADGVAVDDLGSTELVATYFDTEDRRLLTRGVTFRHRRGEGGEDGIWTLKLPASGRGATLDRRELEWPLPVEQRPEAAVALVAGLCRGAALAEVAVLRTTRRRLVLRDADGRSLAEVDDDLVSATSAGPPMRFRQVEVELTGGDAAIVRAVSRRLRDAHARLASPEPKVKRVLTAGAGIEPAAPRPALGRSSTLGEVAVESIAAAVDRLLANDPGVRLSEDPEAVHQARVAVRRLRSDLEVLGPLFDAAWLNGVQRELRWLAGALGRVRDIDVLGLRIEAEGDRNDEWSREGLDALTARLHALRVPAAADLAVAMRGTDYFGLVDRLDAAIDAPPWWEDVAGGSTGDRLEPSIRASKALPPLLRRRWRKVERSVGMLSDPPTGDELHGLRKRAKRLRYNAELATPVVGPKAADLAAGAEALQEVLGEHHDAVVAGAWMRQAAEAGATSEAFSAGELAASARRVKREAEARWPAAWGALAGKRGQRRGLLK